MRRVCPRAEPEPERRFETPPGRQGQVDFAEFVLPWGKRHALLVMLGYSRMLWFQYYERQTMETVVRGLEAAFAFFGSVPSELLFDQMRAVVVGDRRREGERLLENREFRRSGTHWGFRIRACKAGRAQTKGKVERRPRVCNFRRPLTGGCGGAAGGCARWHDGPSTAGRGGSAGGGVRDNPWKGALPHDRLPNPPGCQRLNQPSVVPAKHLGLIILLDVGFRNRHLSLLRGAR